TPPLLHDALLPYTTLSRCDRPADFRTQHPPGGVLGNVLQLRQIVQAALVIRAEHLLIEQALDELAEQGLVEELRRVEAMQDRQALGHHGAQRFQLLGGQAAVGVVQQQRRDHVEASEHLDDAARQQRQQHEFAGGGIRAVDLTAFLKQQAAADQPVHIALYHRRQVLVLPVHEQLALQIGIQRTDQTLDLLPVHARVVEEQTGDQRR